MSKKKTLKKLKSKTKWKEVNDGVWEIIQTSHERIFNAKPSQLVDSISTELGYNLREISKGNKQTH